MHGLAPDSDHPATPATTTDSGLVVSAPEATVGVSVPGMKTGQIVRDDPTMPIDVRWPLVPGATALNDTVEGFARSASAPSCATPSRARPRRRSSTSAGWSPGGRARGRC